MADGILPHGGVDLGDETVHGAKAYGSRVQGAPGITESLLSVKMSQFLDFRCECGIADFASERVDNRRSGHNLLAAQIPDARVRVHSIDMSDKQRQESPKKALGISSIS
jgi:hypothetical protein